MTTTARPSAATEVEHWLERFDSALRAGDRLNGDRHVLNRLLTTLRRNDDLFDTAHLGRVRGIGRRMGRRDVAAEDCGDRASELVIGFQENLPEVRIKMTRRGCETKMSRINDVRGGPHHRS